MVEVPNSNTNHYDDDDATTTRTELEAIFREIDADGSGTIDPDELLGALSHRGYTASSDDVRRAVAAFAVVDADGSGTVSFEEFERAFRPLVDQGRDTNRTTEGRARWLNLRRKRPRQEGRRVTVDRLLLEWRSLGEPLSIGSDLDLLLPPLTPAIGAVPRHAHEQQPTEVPLWRFALTGALSGALGRIVTAPLEKVSLMQQVSATDARHAVAAAVEEGGFRSLWAGAGWNGFRVALFGGLASVGTAKLLAWFPVPTSGARDGLRGEFGDGIYWIEPAWRGGMGALSGLVATVVTHPLDVVRTRVTLNDVRHVRGSEALADSSGPAETVRAVMGMGGPRALWRGLVPACIGVVPFAAAQHSLYDWGKHSAVQYREPTVSLFVCCGVAAGVAAQTLVYPLEVVRRRMIDVGSGGSKLKFTMRSAFRAVIRDGGVPRLWAGIFPTYLRVAPSVLISLLVRNEVVGRLDGK